MATVNTLKKNDERVEDPRRARILDGAKQVFLAYGFSRTTMDDIARAVEISRPALYLLFRNKADIFRAVGQRFLDQSLMAALCVLRNEEGPLGARLMTALDRALFQLFRAIEDSPHGEEIVDVENRIAADIVAEWRQRLVDAFTETIAAEARMQGTRLEELGLTAQALAEMLFDIFQGLKARGLCNSMAEERARQFVTLVELSLNKRRES